MDFVSHAERASALVNAPLETSAALREHVADRAWLHPRITERDAPALARFQRRLRPVFDHADAGLPTESVGTLNSLLHTHRITPMIVAADGDRWQLHVADRAASVADLLVAESLMGLSVLVCDHGPDRLGVCAADGCANTYIDLSPNRSRRYCSERCASRANVAAYRARRRTRERG
ncbi:CGNR zinc finger protein [Mumia flava]|uniref:CGNR zinc finger protein n=1 Tax=Mumia flava TaxID=1348852 RepID=A0A0B2BU71_9ACTN|nr:CGNR zinc finger domain-containing protein [Mumia flava]PJJ56989.1 CGNR zinc finger protein [Mumia flava]